MRLRTLVAGIALATFTTVLGAPAALAAPDDDQEPDKDTTTTAAAAPVASLSVSPGTVRPGESFTATATCTEDATAALTAPGVSFSGATGTVADDTPPGTVTVTLTCSNDQGKDTATDTVTVLAAEPEPPQAKQPPPQPDPDPQPDAKKAAPAALDVSPDERRPGERFRIDFHCPPGPGDTTLAADPGVLHLDPDLRGGTVADGTRPGTVTLTLTCPNGDTATDRLRVVEPRRPYLDLDPNDGYRDDRIDVEAYCPGTADARLDSPALDDIVLRRGGDGTLRGRTRVEDGAAFGDSWAQVLCAGGERPKDRFFVKEHRSADLDLDPAFGRHGDQIKVYVVCDFSVGRLQSDVLTDVEPRRDDDDPRWRYRATATVEDDADGGEHTVEVRCGDRVLTEEFFVIVDPDHGTADKGPVRGGTQVTVYPEGAPQTGGGPAGGPVTALGLAGLTGFGTLPGRRGRR